METMFDLTGMVALVTGGSRGLGREMCLAFADRGADVVIASRKLENCESLAREIEAKRRKALPIGVNVGDWQQMDELVDRAYDTFGKVDILVNNAGMSPLYPSLDAVSESLFDKVIAVNLKAPFRLAALIGKRMIEGEGGSIINVSSTAAVHPAINAAVYGAAKAGLNNLTETLAQVLGPKVRVNCIMPGPFLTDISKSWDMDIFNEQAKTKALRRGGQPEEIVGAAVYLASRASSFTTGAIIRIDGG